MGKKFFNIKFFLAVFVFAAVSFTAMAFFWKKNSHKAPEVRDYTVTQSGLAELLVKPTELVLGDINAPITLISYDSFSCIHCAEFYKHTFKNLEENYIKTGKVKFVHRDLPLDKVAKDITQVFACLKEKNEIDAQKYYKIVYAFYVNQSSIISNNAFKDFFRLSGFSIGLIDECLANKAYYEKFDVSNKLSIQTLNIYGTPTFFVNNKQFDKSPSYANLKAEFDNLLSQK